MVLSLPRASSPTRLRLPPSQASSFVRETDPRLLNKHHHHYYESVMRCYQGPWEGRWLDSWHNRFSSLTSSYNNMMISRHQSWKAEDLPTSASLWGTLSTVPLYYPGRIKSKCSSQILSMSGQKIPPLQVMLMPFVHNTQYHSILSNIFKFMNDWTSASVQFCILEP